MAPLVSANTVNYTEISEKCRQIALHMDWLSRYQDREACSKNLDGLNTYIASNYILVNRLKEANEIIDKSIILTNFAIDIGCYGQADMQ